MTGLGVNNRTSRSDSSARAVQTPPLLTKRAQTKWPKWVLQLAHKIDVKVCRIPAETHPLLAELSRKKLNKSAILREFMNLPPPGSPDALDLADFQGLDQFQLYRVYKNFKQLPGMDKILDDLVETFARLQPTSEHDLLPIHKRESEFIGTVIGLRLNLVQTWRLLVAECKAKDVRLVSIPDKVPKSLELKKLIEQILKPAFNNLGRDYVRAPAELIKAELLRDRLSPALAAVQDHFNSTGTIKPDFEDLLDHALERAGIANGSERRKLAQDVGSDLMDLTAEYGRELLDALLSTMSEEKFGPLSRDVLLAIIANIDKLAHFPEARTPHRALDTVRSVHGAADRLHDLGLKVLQDYPDEALVDMTKWLLGEETTPEMAQDFLRYANMAKLEGRSSLVRQGIRNYVTEAKLHQKI
jgi:hypothetical protein